MFLDVSIEYNICKIYHLMFSDGEHHIRNQGHQPQVDLGLWDWSPSRRTNRARQESV